MLFKKISNYIASVVPEIYNEIDAIKAGFIQSTLQQRFCSSFYAFHQSIITRSNKLKKVLEFAIENI